MAPTKIHLLSKRLDDISAPALAGIIVAGVSAALIMVCILYVITDNVAGKEPSESSATPAVTQRPPSSRVSGTSMVQSQIPEALTEQRSSKTNSAEGRPIALHLHTANVANMVGNLPKPAVTVKTPDADATKASEGRTNDDTHPLQGEASTMRRSSVGKETDSMYSTTSASPQQHKVLLRQINNLLTLPPSSITLRPLPKIPPTVVHRTVDATSSTSAVPSPFVEPRPALTTIYSHPYNYNPPRGDPRPFGSDDPYIVTESALQHSHQVSRQLSPVHVERVPLVRPEDWGHRTPASSVGPSAASVSLLDARPSTTEPSHEPTGLIPPTHVPFRRTRTERIPRVIWKENVI